MKPLFLVFGLSLLTVVGCSQRTDQKKPASTPATTATQSNPAADNAPTDGRNNPNRISAKADEWVVMSWNLCNFGKSKSDEEIAFIANTVRYCDILAVQEVSTTNFGAQAVAKLADELDRKGADWDYAISDPTSGEGSERYAFLWKTSRVSLKNKAFLSQPLANTINREPFMGRFENKQGKTLLIANFHAVPSAKKPETEIAQLDQLHTSYTSDNLMVMGDFNYASNKPGFDNLKRKGYAPALNAEPTSLKMKPEANGNYFNAAYDNIFYETAVFNLIQYNKIDFVPQLPSLEAARKIADHVPVWVKVKVK